MFNEPRINRRAKYYEDLLKLLSNFNTDDEILHSLSIGLKGDTI